MDCLQNAIGISQSCGNGPYPLGYIDELDGISLKSLSSVEGGKYLSAQNMLNSKVQVVAGKMKERLGALLGDTMIEQSVQSIIPIQFSDVVLTGAYGHPGLRIEKKPTTLTNLYIPRFYFKSQTAVEDLVVTISDGHLSVDHLVTAEANEEVAIECNFQSSNLEITITYDAAQPSQTVEPYSGNISPYTTYGCDGCVDCGGCNGNGNFFLKMRSIDFDGEERSKYYGLRADVQMVCDVEKMICIIAPKNAWIIKYMTGVEIALESVATDRLNFFAINSKDWWKEAAQRWQWEADRLWDLNGPSMLKMLQKSDSQCFTCTGRHTSFTIG